MADSDHDHTAETTTKDSGYVRHVTRFAAIIAFICVVLIGIGAWLVSTQSGMQWLLATVSRVSNGTLDFIDVEGDISNLRIGTVRYVEKNSSVKLETFILTWRPADLLNRQLTIDQLSMQTVSVNLPPPDNEKTLPKMPENLVLPLELSILKVSVGSIDLYPFNETEAEQIISDVAFSLHSDGEHHHLQRFGLVTQWGSLAGSMNLNGHAPFPLTAQIELHSTQSPSVIHGEISGNFARMHAQFNTQQHESNAKIQAEIAPFAAQPVVNLDISANNINPAQWVADAPNAHLAMIAHLHGNVQQQLEGAIAIQNNTPATIDQNGLPFSEIRTQALVSQETIRLHDLRIRNGKQEVVRGSVDWQLDNNTGMAHLMIDKLNPKIIDKRIQAAQISGEIELKGDVYQQTARIDLKDNAMMLNASLTRLDQLITLQHIHLQSKKSQWRGKGSFHLDRDQSFDFSSQLTNFNLADFIQAPDSNLNASIDIAGKLASEPSGKLNYVIKDSHIKKSPLSGAGYLTFNGLNQFSGKAELKIAANHVLAQGGFGKTNDALQLTINAPALEHMGLGVSGDLKGTIKLGGNLKTPAVQANIVSTKLKLSDQQQITDFSLNTQLKNDIVELKLTAQSMSANKSAKLEQLEMRVDGTHQQHHISVNTRVNSESTFNLKARGSLDLKQSAVPQWQGKIAQLSLTGKIPLELTAPASLFVSTDKVSLGALQLSASNGKIDIEQTHWTPTSWKTKGQFSGIAVLPGEFIDSQEVPLHLGGDWDLASGAQLNGHLKIQREKGDWFLPGENPQPLQLETLQLSMIAQRGKISANFLSASPLIGDAKAQIMIPTRESGNGWTFANNAPLQGAVDAQINNLKWMNPLLNDGTSLNGNLKIAATIMGTLDDPNFNGTISGQQLSVLMLEQGIQLQQGNLTASFHETDLNIQRLHFVSPHVPAPDERFFKELKLKNNHGSVKINGNVSLIGNKTQLNFSMDEFQLASKTDYWMVTSGSGQIIFQDKRLNVFGNLLADAGLLLQPPEGHPEVSDDVVIYTPGAAKNNPRQSKISLLMDVTFNLGENFHIYAAGLKGRLAGQLQVRNDERNALKAKGSITAQDTTYKAYGQDLTVKRGMVNFNGPIDDPGLNVLAVREGLEVVAGVEISGTVRQPRVKLISTPDVPDSEKLSWIALGRKPDASGVDASALLTAASAILGGQSGGGITDQLRNAIGLDEISFKQAAPGSSLTGQIGIVGKRISSRIYISYERSLLTNTMGITKLTYSLTPKITIVTQAGEDNAADLFYTLQFD
ncbi:MAG TPA: translocation/assembly module TamB domain-containing protein [Nitrosomonas sp.]|nr:translocation/assembly module TamB domain-containing protein [Nitrosomonas sp.]HQX13366.1 translocation/assembly module TamB domain-containing protein [Nitrosomonas sp.]HRB31723.1 translocation/assembly module TamB domain-containing protein [Nitrosomonas sp.]HRB44437.1 translocation/assembly module TamB domain-containing protein [Nitrosomonas sp.]HRB76718.1 translocation/assembly module TamB domain-containing protein [Nitrosomonas sp.]